MTKTSAVTEAFTSLNEVESKFNFSRTTDSQFFPEWYENLPELEDRGEIYRGRIDVLVLQNQLWLTLIESKQTKFSFSIAIPQALAYMMVSPQSHRPTFGLVTNGDNFIFIKLVKQPVVQYDLSTDFSVFATMFCA